MVSVSVSVAVVVVVVVRGVAGAAVQRSCSSRTFRQRDTCST
ncbi:hypothetical protein [Streptomyces sp. AP-93]|nr:hypothetical protein [Streptomyces sp. AP-93]